MSLRPQISVILSSYNRPTHLLHSLVSLAYQRGVDGQFEVVVTDDGSTDDTADVVSQFARSAEFPVLFTTHEHRGYRLARCRNEGTRASSAPYLLFSDADCLFPPEHLFHHLRVRRHGVAYSGEFLRLDEQSTQRLDREAIAAGAYQTWVSTRERWRVYRRQLKDRFYEAIGHPLKPKLKGCNIAVWRSDLERVNGFDERFVGWGCEDDDFAQRLRRADVRVATILSTTRVYHMWHPAHTSQPGKWRDGANVKYFLRSDKPIRCAVGLTTDSPHGSSPPPSAPVDRRTRIWQKRPAA